MKVGPLLLLCVAGRVLGDDGGADVYILAGQSNMVGSSAVQPDPDVPDLFLAGAAKWGQEVETEWLKVNAKGSLRAAWNGPEYNFARQVAGHTGRKVYVLKWAFAGTSLHSQWLGTDGLYARLQQRKDHYLSYFEREGLGSPRVKGFFWMQGETDAFWQQSSHYLDNLRELVRRVREDFEVPDLPVLVARLSNSRSFLDNSHWKAVREAQVEWATTDPHGHWVDTDTIPLSPDLLHYSHEGFEQLGVALADAYLNSIGIQPGVLKPLLLTTPEPGYDQVLLLKDVNEGVFRNPRAEHTDHTYSVIDRLGERKEEYLHGDAPNQHYVFKLKFWNVKNGQREDEVVLVWRQTSWLTDEVITGFQPISLPDVEPFKDAVFEGLGLSDTWRTPEKLTLLDGNAGKTYWFNAVGVTKTLWGGIPGYNKVVTSEELLICLPGNQNCQ